MELPSSNTSLFFPATLDSALVVFLKMFRRADPSSTTFVSGGPSLRRCIVCVEAEFDLDAPDFALGVASMVVKVAMIRSGFRVDQKAVIDA